MPMDVLPEFAPPYVEVQAEALGLSASEVESLVTISLEQLLVGTPWLDSIRSTSVSGLSSVVLTFKRGTDVTRARQLVAERLTSSVAFAPNVSSPPVILQPLSATSRVLMVGLSSRTVTPTEMSLLARWTIRPALLAVPGVANVAIWGQRDRQLQVRVDPRQLATDRVSLDQIITTAGNAMWVSPLTYLQASRPGAAAGSRPPSSGSRSATPSRSPARPGCPGERRERQAEPRRRRLRGRGPPAADRQRDPEGRPRPPARDREVPEGEHDRRDPRGRDDVRPPGSGLAGITVNTHVFRPASFIETSFDNLTLSLLVGGLLALLVLVGFFADWRSLVVSAVAVPSSLLTALLVLQLRGSTMNVMVLAGLLIALVVVVDDAIVDVEHIGRRLRERRSDDRGGSAVAAIAEASVELRRVLAYGTLVVVAPLLPVFFLHGVSGSLLRPLALSYGLAILASMLVALTVTPALSAVVRLSGPRETRFVRWLNRRYEAALGRVIETPGPVLVAAAGTLAVGLAVTPFFGQSLLPTFKDPNLVVQWDGPPGTSEPEMTRITSRVGDELRTLPDVQSVAGQIGRAVLGDRAVDVNSAQLWVTVDQHDRGRALAAVRKAVDGYPGIVRGVQTYEQESIRRVQTGSSDPIVVRVLGPNPAVLGETAARVRRALAGIPGVHRLDMPRRVEQPHVAISVDLARAERHGLKPGDVRRAVATLLAGLEVGSLYQDQKVFQVVVWSPAVIRGNLTDVRRLLIDTPDGGTCGSATSRTSTSPPPRA